jgi:hypothetical protein
LIVAGLFVSVNIKLGIQWETCVGLIIILVPFDMFKDRFDFHALEGRDYLIRDVPVGLECEIWERVRVWQAPLDASQQAKIVSHKLNSPRRGDAAEVMKAQEESRYGKEPIAFSRE